MIQLSRNWDIRWPFQPQLSLPSLQLSFLASCSSQSVLCHYLSSRLFTLPWGLQAAIPSRDRMSTSQLLGIRYNFQTTHTHTHKRVIEANMIKEMWHRICLKYNFWFSIYLFRLGLWKPLNLYMISVRFICLSFIPKKNLDKFFSYVLKESSSRFPEMKFQVLTAESVKMIVF